MQLAFDDNGHQVAVDPKTPLDDIEPLDIDRTRADISLAEVVFRIAASFREGNPLVTASSWLYILRGDDASMRRRAKQLGVTVAALSRRARILAESFGLKLNDPHIRELRRRLAKEAWARRKKRRADRSRPAANAQLDEQPNNRKGAHE